MANCYYTENGYFRDGLVNFSVGTVGPDIMNDCVEIFAKATQHRLVSTYSVCSLNGEQIMPI